MEPPSGSELVGRHWLITGRVQGVGFRWFVMNHAQMLGIRGWARNTPEGDVEVVGVATAATIDRFDQLLAKGPPGSRVMDVKRSEVQHEAVEGKSFSIKH